MTLKWVSNLKLESLLFWLTPIGPSHSISCYLHCRKKTFSTKVSISVMEIDKPVERRTQQPKTEWISYVLLKMGNHFFGY